MANNYIYKNGGKFKSTSSGTGETIRPHLVNENCVREGISVCHIIFQLAYGGLENGLVNLINRLPSDYYRHTIICLKDATDFQQRICRPNVGIFEINKKDGKDFSAYVRVWRLLRKLRPDIVHTRNLPTIDMLAPALLAGVRRLIHSEHGLDIAELDGHLKKYNQLRWSSKFVVRRYVSVSRDLITWLHGDIGIPENKISLIYNGVDIERFRPSTVGTPPVWPSEFASRDALVIGTIGRLQPIKGHVRLAEAFVRLLALRPELRSRLRLVIIGDGSEHSKITKVLEGSNALELAWLPGFRNDTADLYRNFDIFVLPSLREGISNTALEAMASGLPVVATDVGGNPEIIIDGETGQLVRRDDADMMANRLLLYIDNPKLARAHGRAGRERAVSEFSLDTMVESYCRLYENL